MISSSVITQSGNIAGNVNTDSVPIKYGSGVGIFLNLVVGSTPAPIWFYTDLTTDICYSIGVHGYSTGLHVLVYPEFDQLPTPLGDNYIINRDATSFYMASSQANALLGIHVDITFNGDGNAYAYPVGFSAASFSVQGSADEILWVNIPSTTTSFSATGNYMFEFVNMNYNFIRVAYTIPSGACDYVLNTVIKEDKDK